MNALISVVAIGIYLYIYVLLGRAFDANSYASYNQILNQVDLVESLYYYVEISLTILTMVYFIMWFRRAYFNLHSIRSEGRIYGEGMAAGAWFLPIFSLFGPYQIAKDMVVTSEALLNNEGHIGQEESMMKWVNIWWACWLATNILPSAGNFLVVGQESYLLVNGVLAVISIIAAFFAIRFVMRYHQLEMKLVQLEQVDGTLHGVNDDLLDTPV